MKSTPPIENILLLIRKMETMATELKAAGAPVSRLDMDVMLGDTRRIYDLLLTLNRQNQKEPSIENSSFGAVESPVKAVESPPAPADIEPVEVASAEEVTEEQTPAEEAPADQRFRQKRAEKMAERRSDIPPGLFDQVPEPAGTPSQSVHEKLAQATESKSLADKLSSVPACDLKKIIGINEKFKFVNDLFEGNLQDYNDCINKLNNAGTLVEAETLAEQVVLDKYEAARESATYQSLLLLIQKKFNR